MGSLRHRIRIVVNVTVVVEFCNAPRGNRNWHRIDYTAIEIDCQTKHWNSRLMENKPVKMAIFYMSAKGFCIKESDRIINQNENIMPMGLVIPKKEGKGRMRVESEEGRRENR